LSATEGINLLLRVRNTPETGTFSLGCDHIFKVERFVLSRAAAHPGRLRVRECGGVEGDVEGRGLGLRDMLVMNGLEWGTGRESRLLVLLLATRFRLLLIVILG
jgi:hypothetical protein